jgi:lipopolysaccharide export system protein LptA
VNRVRRRGEPVGTVLRAGLGALLLVVGALWPGAPAEAQDLGTDCELRDYISLRSSAAVAGRRVTWVTGPFLVCPDGTRIRSDSAVVYEDTGRAELMGRVQFDSEGRELRSDRADYFEREGRLLARGQVVFRDLVRGSVVRGDTLAYLEAGPLRSEDQVTVTGGRPTATLPPPEGRDEGGYDVTGDRLRFEGDRFFWADGDVEVVRADLEAYADSLAFDQEEGRLILNRDARVVGEADIQGDQIVLLLPDDVLESVTVRGRGRLQTEELDVVGEEIRITLEDERIQRLMSVHRSPPEGEDPRPRPRAVTEDFSVEGDSIDVMAPDEVLETLFASGRARGERRTPGAPPLPVESPDDTAAIELLDPAGATEAESGLPESVLERDWIEGDELLAVFEPVEGDPMTEPDDPDAVPPPADPETGQEGPRVQLERLEARGNARTLYRSPPEENDAPEPEAGEDPRLWPISYIMANEIRIYMLEGAVERLEARGEVRGIQLDPEPQRPATDSQPAAATSNGSGEEWK